MMDGTGLDLVKYVSQHHASMPICLVTAYSSPDQAVQALKEGAFDYLSKPVAVADLRRVVSTMVAQSHTNHQDNLPILIAEKIAQRLPGQSTAMKAIHVTLAQLAQTSACVVIQGERGTGKELAARALHACSVRATQPFIVFDCSTADNNRTEHTLFGSQQDSSIGTVTLKDGAFQTAHGGTLLLDEVGKLPLDIQLTLLNTLQQKTVRRHGATHTDSIDVRVLVSTTTPLAQLVASGQFRQDLYYRLNIMALSMPPLRERNGDAPWLAQRWLTTHPQGKTMILSAGALSWLRSHPFTGNVRELDNMMERSVALCAAQLLNVIEVSHLHMTGNNTLTSIPITPPSYTNTTVVNSLEDEDFSGAERRRSALTFPMDLTSHLANIERRIIEQALQQARYNRGQAATLLGLNLRQIRYRMEQLGIEC
jgi:two-component system response regulator PilR (NtrC family)